MKTKAPINKRVPKRVPKEALKRERKVWILLLSASLFFNLLIFASPSFADRSESHRLQHLLQYLLHYMQTLYVEPVSEERLIEGAARGLLEAADDPYTRYLNKEEFRKFRNIEEGSQVGVGLEVDVSQKLPTVIAPIPGGPAEEAGVLPGDQILAINDTRTQNLSIEELTLLISGDSNTSVRLKLKREGATEPLILPVVRRPFKLDYVHSHFFTKEEIGYIQLLHFLGENSGSIEEFHQALQNFKRRNVKGLIIDLRNNPGGHLNMAVTLTSYFLKPGQLIVEIKGREERDAKKIVAKKENAPSTEKLPLILLINGNSASASEIMAAALRDHGRARLVGSQSYGKASVQNVVRDLPGGAAALLTTRKYYTPTGEAIHNKGLKPDIKIEDLQLSAIDHYFLENLHEKNFFTNFRAEHPQFSEQLVVPFLQKVAPIGWKLSPQLSLLILKKEYRLYHPYKVDLSIDPPLHQALQELVAAKEKSQTVKATNTAK